MTPSKAAFLQTAFFETFARIAGAQIVAAQFFFQHLVAVDDLLPLLYLCFRGEPASSLTHCLEKTVRSRNVCTDSSRTFLFCREFGSNRTPVRSKGSRRCTSNRNRFAVSSRQSHMNEDSHEASESTGRRCLFESLSYRLYSARVCSHQSGR